MIRAIILACLTACSVSLGGCATTSTPLDYPPKSVIPATQDADWAIDWWMPRHQEKIAQKKAMKNNVDLVFVGDSITHGWEDGGKETWQDYYEDRNALNLGFAGDRTENVLWRLENGAIDDIRPELVVVMIGTNNAGGRKEDPAATALGIRAIIDLLEIRLPDAKVLLLAIFPRGKDDSDPYRRLNMATNQIIQQYADGERVFWLNINAEFLDEHRVLQTSVMEDLLHPNPSQYRVWADAIEPTVKQLMGD